MRQRIIHSVLVLVLGVCLVSAANAAPRKGFTLIGAPKYPDDFPHYDFVNPDAPKGGTIKFGVTGTFDSLQPWLIRGQAAAGLNLMYDTLMARSPDEPFALYPLVAKTVDFADNKKSITFDLDERARFHNGKPITADDILYSFNQLKRYGRPNTRRMYAMVDKLKVITPHRVTFELREGYDSELPMILAMMVVLPKEYWRDKNFDRTSLQPPLGSGPYRIKSVEPGRRIIYERVTDYWAKDLNVNVGLYNFDIISYDYYRDENIALQAFKSGAFDVRREGDPVRWQVGYNSPALNNGDIEKAEIIDGKPEGFRAFVFNMRNDKFKDIRVRKALSLAFDFEWMNRALYRGAYKRTASLYPKSVLAAEGVPGAEELKILEPYRRNLVEDVFGPAYQPPRTDGSGPAGLRDNLRRAQDLFFDAGYDLEGGKLVHRLTKQRFMFEILLSDPNDEKLALEYARALKRLGITATIRTVDSAQYTGRLAAYDFDMIIYRFISTLSPGSEQLVYWGSQSANMKGSRNYAGIQSPAVDAIAASLTEAKDYAALVARARALDRVIMHTHYFIPLFYQPADWIAYWKTRLVKPPAAPLYGTFFESWWAAADNKK